MGKKHVKHRLIPDTDDYYSTGIQGMDEILGAYPKGSFVILEMMDDTLSWASRSLLFHTFGLTRFNMCDENEVRRVLSDAIVKLKEANDLVIGISKPSVIIKEDINEMADVHIKLLLIDGAFYIYMKPKMMMHNISPVESSDGYHTLKITPFV
jgi:hypothetical protein